MPISESHPETESTDWFEILDPDRPIHCRVKQAAFLAVRYSGGIGVAITVTCDKESSTTGERPAVAPTLQLIMSVPQLLLEPGSCWVQHLRDLSQTDINVPPLITDDDDRLVMDFRVDVVSRAAEIFHLRCEGHIPTFTHPDKSIVVSIDANFEFRGFADHIDERLYPVRSPFSLHMKSKGNWQKYLQDELQLQMADGPVTDYEWRHTDQFRRLVRQSFPPAPPPSRKGPYRGIFSRLRDRFWKPAPRVSDRDWNPPTNRQSLLLLAATMEQFLILEDWDEARHQSGRNVVECLERYAEGAETASDRNLVHTIQQAQQGHKEKVADELHDCLRWATDPQNAQRFFLGLHWMNEKGRDVDDVLWQLVPQRSRRGCAILRDLLGNPFQPVSFDPEWRTSTAIRLAKAAYEGRDFSLLPMLADALVEAGCDHDAILTHCRSARPHVRGCWVVEQVLGRNGISNVSDEF